MLLHALLNLYPSIVMSAFDVGMDFPIAARMYTTNYDGGDCVIRTDSGINSLEVDDSLIKNKVVCYLE